MPDSKPDDMISTSEAGRMLGITSKTIIRMIESSQIPGYRINFVWRLRRQDVSDYLEAHRYKPDQQKQDE
jgi:excisionase family DNA binding protein